LIAFLSILDDLSPIELSDILIILLKLIIIRI
jgi:hypothetical protein